MSWIVGILSVFLVLACLLLMLLVLIQLPKKEAGMGQAFGGGATDALFGAGSGTALTDSATLTGGNSPTGTLTFTLYAPDGKHFYVDDDDQRCGRVGDERHLRYLARPADRDSDRVPFSRHRAGRGHFHRHRFRGRPRLMTTTN